MSYDPKFNLECPEDMCEWCWENLKEVSTNADGGGLCDLCNFERAVCAADALHDRMKEGD